MCGRGDWITARLHCGNETEFLPHFLPVVLANDLPQISPYDDAVDNRVHVANFGKIFVDEPRNEMELKSDPNIKKEIDSDRFQDHFLSLLIREYKTVSPPPPAALRTAKNAWLNVDDESIIGKFLASYAFSNDPGDFVPNSVFASWLKDQNAACSINKFSKGLCRHLASLANDDTKYIENKLKKQNGTSSRGWYGIKNIGYN